MKEGDIVNIFADPDKCTGFVDQAKLIEKIADYTYFERWSVEYTNDEGKRYVVLIKKQPLTNNLINDNERPEKERSGENG